LVYLAWWLWATQFGESVATASNVLLIPAYALTLFAAATSALTGLGIDFAEPKLATVDTGWGVVLVPALVAVGIWGIRRRSTADPVIWGALAFVAILSISLAMAYGPLRAPDQTRYLYPVIVGMLLVLAACWRGRPATPAGVALVIGLAALALLPNLWLLGKRGEELRALSERTEATLAMIELERESVAPEFTVGDIKIPIDAEDYLNAVDEFGSPMPAPAAIAEGTADARAAADETLAAILAPAVAAAPDDAAATCDADPAPQVELAPGPNILQSDAGGSLLLQRFADAPSIEAGAMAAGTPVLLSLPSDASEAPPWRASVPGAELQICRP
jgi:hypothetical protein